MNAEQVTAELMALADASILAHEQFARRKNDANYGALLIACNDTRRALEQAIRRAVEQRFEKLPPPDLRKDPPCEFVFDARRQDQ